MLGVFVDESHSHKQMGRHGCLQAPTIQVFITVAHVLRQRAVIRL